jgi:tetratricopeptide (TPR) repeat protein
LFKIGKYKKAAEISERALALDPYNPWSLLYRSDAYLRLGDTEKAMTGYEESARNEKVADRARKGILHCLEISKDWERILGCVAQWDLPFFDSVSCKVNALTNLHRFDEAIALCNDWLQKFPDNKQALWLLVNIQIESDGLDTVLSQYERLAKIPSRPPIYGEIYASLCRKTGHSDKALTQYEKMERTTQDMKISRQKAFTLAKTGHETEAIPLLEELLRLSPTDQYLHTSYTSANNRINTPKRIVDFYRELIKLFPDEMTLLGRVKKIQKSLDSTTGPSASQPATSTPEKI